MTTKNMLQFLRYMEAHDAPIFDTADMVLWFKASLNTVQQAVKRHITNGLIMRAARGFYISGINSGILGKSPLVFVPYLRPGEFSYESFESRLSGLGLISQVPFVTTVATTGRSGKVQTCSGVVEFTHVAGQMSRRLAQTAFDLPVKVPLANEELALYDLHCANRNTGLVEESAWGEFNWREYDER